jgi:hypothetical protein
VKKSLKVIALAGILGLTAWLGTVQKANAIARCSLFNGGPCGSEGFTVNCLRDDGTIGQCHCSGGEWSCG